MQYNLVLYGGKGKLIFTKKAKIDQLNKTVRMFVIFAA